MVDGSESNLQATPNGKVWTPPWFVHALYLVLWALLAWCVIVPGVDVLVPMYLAASVSILLAFCSPASLGRRTWLAFIALALIVIPYWGFAGGASLILLRMSLPVCAMAMLFAAMKHYPIIHKRASRYGASDDWAYWQAMLGYGGLTWREMLLPSRFHHFLPSMYEFSFVLLLFAALALWTMSAMGNFADFELRHLWT